MSDFEARASAPQSLSKDLVIAQRLPVEILITIFELLILPARLTRVHLSRHRNADVQTWSSLPYVCTQWYRPALSVLYASIEIRTYKETLSFLRTLQIHPHLRPLIKSLHLPMRVRVRCPPEVQKLFCQIIHLVEDLQEMSTTGIYTQGTPQHPGTVNQTHVENATLARACLSLPIAPDRHQGLVYLELRGERTPPAISLPNQLLAFRCLRRLTLADVVLTEQLDPKVFPTLPLLETISFYNRNSLLLLDDWLCAHPNLQTLGMYEAQGPSTIPRIVSSGRIKYMEMMHCVAHQWRGASISSWFNACKSLRKLRVSDDLFLHHPDLLPTNLEELRLEIARHWLDLSCWKTYFDRDTNLGRFILSAHPSRAWYRDLGQTTISYAMERTPNFVFEPPICNCSDGPRKQPFEFWTNGADRQNDIMAWDWAPECECE